MVQLATTTLICLSALLVIPLVSQIWLFDNQFDSNRLRGGEKKLLIPSRVLIFVLTSRGSRVAAHVSTKPQLSYKRPPTQQFQTRNKCKFIFKYTHNYQMKIHLLIPKLATLFSASGWAACPILFEALLCEPLVKLKTCPNYIICLPSMLSSPRFYGQQQCKYFPQITKQQKAALLCPKIQSKAGQFKDNYQVGAMPCHPPCAENWPLVSNPVSSCEFSKFFFVKNVDSNGNM